jgi:hypothetical protein
VEVVVEAAAEEKVDMVKGKGADKIRNLLRGEP